MPGDWAFEHLSRSAVETTLGPRSIQVCSKEDLITMKRAAGHPQDLVDLEQLDADPSP